MPNKIPSYEELQNAREWHKHLRLDPFLQRVEKVVEEVVTSEMNGIPNTFWTQERRLVDAVVLRLVGAGWDAKRCKRAQTHEDRWGSWSEHGFGVRVE